MAYRLLTGANSYFSYSGRVTALDGATRIQVSLWWKPVTNGSQYRQNLVMQADNVATSGLYVGCGAEPLGTFRFSNIGTPVKTYTGFTPVDTWYHAFVSMDGTTGALYRNGTNVSASLTGGSLEADCDANTNPFYLGRHSNDALAQYSNCELAEVAIWVGGSLLDTTAIDQLAAGRLPTAQSAYLASLVFYAPLREHGHDVVGGLVGTAQNSPVLVAHPSAVDVYVDTSVPTLSVRVNEVQVGGATF